ncbi:flagellar hook-length control protein FliK [Methylobacterium crusticola]|uniref:flagellar hook-length control protein FliK n=1 Tax=Methylobacterium crusticola TaxID=1697972 RepID=UPI001EE30E62|nr:flagellar hook-length control protein FliK [Methylobacterium crusticola]
MRLLTLQLHPADLGAVVVRMRLQDGRLEMNLHAGREETAELLRRDGGALAELLRGAGYRPDVVVQPGGSEPPQDRAGARDPAPSFGGGADGQNQGGAAPDQPARRPAVPDGHRIEEQGHEAHPGERDRGGLYL